jgi:membrane-associated phospholipid phosphatase
MERHRFDSPAATLAPTPMSTTAPREVPNRPRIRRQPHGLASHTVLLAGLSAVALAACAKVGEDVFSKETSPFDEPIRNWVLDHQSAAGEHLFTFASRAGGPSVVIPFCALVGLWLRGKRNLPIAGSVLLAPAAALALFISLKQVYRRRRPDGASRRREKTFAFPSGHSASSAAVFGTLGYVLWREEMLGAPAALALGILPPLVIGSSRVYLDVHWATDVLGGWSVGSIVTAMSAVVYERVRTATREKGVPVVSHTAGSTL